MSHLSMFIADSIGRTRGRRARWFLSTYAHPKARTHFQQFARNPRLNLPYGFQHYSVFASTYRHSAASSTLSLT